MAIPIHKIRGTKKEKKFCDKLLFTWNRFGFKNWTCLKIAHKYEQASVWGEAVSHAYALVRCQTSDYMERIKNLIISMVRLLCFYTHTHKKSRTRVNQPATKSCCLYICFLQKKEEKKTATVPCPITYCFTELKMSALALTHIATNNNTQKRSF